MQLSGPSRVSDNGSITVTASGFGKAYSVKFDVAGVSGNVGFDIKETRGSSSVSFSTSMSFAGGERIDALAQDEFGTTIGTASHSFTVESGKGRPIKGGRRHDDDDDGPGNGGGYGPDDGPGAGGGYIIAVEAPAKAEANKEWRYRMRGLKDMHSVLIELYGANGGLFRIFPRGRDMMEHAFIPEAAGATTVIMTGRDSRMRSLVTIAGEILVVQAGALGGTMGGPGAGGGYEPVTKFGPISPMGLHKPPFATSVKTASDAGRSAVGHSTSVGAGGLDALIEAKKAELLARLGKK